MDWRKFQPVRTALLVIAGLVCFVWGAALIYRPAAFIVAGLGLWLVEFLTNSEHRDRR